MNGLRRPSHEPHFYDHFRWITKKPNASTLSISIKPMNFWQSDHFANNFSSQTCDLSLQQQKDVRLMKPLKVFDVVDEAAIATSPSIPHYHPHLWKWPWVTRFDKRDWDHDWLDWYGIDFQFVRMILRVCLLGEYCGHASREMKCGEENVVQPFSVFWKQPLNGTSRYMNDMHRREVTQG